MRPHYHYTPQANWLSDPNGLVHDGDCWHMFYQYNPQGEDWGHMSWGHAVSRDLAHWDELAPALLDDERRMVFSGSAVMDRAGTAGFGRDVMVALYTAAATGEPQHQAQALAWSNDRGTSWTDYPRNPVLDLGMADFRDPYVFRHEPSASWVMVVVKSNEQRAQIYRSADLLRWTLASEIPARDAPGLVWECPTLVELPICGSGQSRWLFKVDALNGAPGAGALYLTGDFDGHTFTPDGPWQVVDHGRDFYAAIAWNGPRDAAGRPAWIGWMGNHAYQKHFRRKGWRGVMSTPRRMGLLEAPDGLRLAQQVEPSVAGLFGDFGALATDGMAEMASRIELSAAFSGALSLADSGTSRFTIRAEGDRWLLQRRDTALPFLDQDAELRRRDGEGLSLWLDSETIEVLSPDGTGAAGFQHRPADPHLSLETDQPQFVSTAALA
ncbi:glycoside hydrolase family 32 protein [Erythrobacter sp. SDW2]|uniref:glycoside hydrolase family 32 protein n=1 Tax=Erythrobacter sp. SDW2 TaxID=2907154 RepID=UPI001F2D5B5A|nr:glycoside hydrolase family 32 protein [Erythrobacter sp. SDW2]UIP06455.1 glycoside hydrolase family 32 protein [Erythrobacter sp. SDW2]